MKIRVYSIFLITLFACNIMSQESTDSLIGNSVVADMNNSNILPEKINYETFLTVNQIIKKSRELNLDRRKKLDSFDVHVFSKTLVKYHLINNPVQLFTDYDGTEYNFFGADESELFEYYNKRGKDNKEKIIVESSRQTSLLEKTFTNYFYPDLYAEEVGIINEKLSGPLGPDCFNRYNFKLLGVDSSAGKKVYRIGVKDKYKYIPAFYGTIFIEDSTFLLKKVDLKTNLAINIPLVKEVRIKTNYENVLDSSNNKIYSVPFFLEINTTASFAGAIKLKINSLAETRKVNFNARQKGIKYDEFEIVVKPGANKKSKEFWEKNGVKLDDSLSNSELDKVNDYKFKPKSSVSFTGSGVRFGENLTWNFLYSYTFNRIEGNHIELNTTYARNFKRFLLNSRLIYGTANEKFTYSFDLAVLPTKNLDVKISAGVFSQLTPLFKKFGAINYIENAISTLVTKKDRVNWYQGDGFSFGVDYRISRYFTFGTDYFSEKQTTVYNNTNFSFVKKDQNYSINHAVNDATTNKISFTMNVDFNRYRMIDWGDGDVTRMRLSILPVMEFRYSNSSKKAFKSTYDFREYHVKITGSVVLGSAFKVIYKTGATLKYGAVPYQELKAIDPKFLGLPNDVSMITPDYSEFLGDRIVFFNIENEFGKIFPFDIPVLSSITLLGDLCIGRTWITDANRQLAPDKNFKSTDGFYTEIGFGLTRILEIGTLRYSWRLNNFKEGSDTFLFFDVGIRY